MKSFYLTDAGRVRCHNEDSVTILKNKNNGMYYLILSKNNNIIEVVNINDNRDYFY